MSTAGLLRDLMKAKGVEIEPYVNPEPPKIAGQQAKATATINAETAEHAENLFVLIVHRVIRGVRLQPDRP